MTVWIVIPAYNEEKRIGGTLKEYSGLIGPLNARIVVASESRDGTNRIVSSYSKANRRIGLIRAKTRLGKGGAVMMGMRYACAHARNGDLVGFLDADAAVPSKQVSMLVNRLKKGRGKIGGVIGSRYMRGSRVIGGVPLSRLIPSRIYNLIVRTLYGMNYADTQCGAKFFYRENFETIINEVMLTDMSFDVNILYAMKLHGYKIAEIPITYKPEMTGSKVVLRWQIIQMFATVVGYRLSVSRLGRHISPGAKGKIYDYFRE